MALLICFLMVLVVIQVGFYYEARRAYADIEEMLDQRRRSSSFSFPAMELCKKWTSGGVEYMGLCYGA
jgi:Na+/melibiose symporter-like transporter